MSQPAIGRQAIMMCPIRPIRIASRPPASTGALVPGRLMCGQPSILTPSFRQRSVRSAIVKAAEVTQPPPGSKDGAGPVKRPASSGAAAMRAKALAAELTWRAATYGTHNPQLVDVANKIQAGPKMVAEPTSATAATVAAPAAPVYEAVAAAPTAAAPPAAPPSAATPAPPPPVEQPTAPAVDVKAIKTVVVKKPASAPAPAAPSAKAGPATAAPAAAAKATPATSAADALKNAAASVKSAIKTVKSAPASAGPAAAASPSSAPPAPTAAAPPTAAKVMVKPTAAAAAARQPATPAAAGTLSSTAAAAPAAAAPGKKPPGAAAARAAPAATAPAAAAAPDAAAPATPKPRQLTVAEVEAARKRKLEEENKRLEAAAALRKQQAIAAQKKAEEAAKKAAEEAAKKAAEEKAKAAAAAREAARIEVSTHNPTLVAANRSSWLVFTVPEKPVAGEECMVYYNRVQSEALRVRPRILLLYGFNQWDLNGNSRIDLLPSSIPKNDCDWWAARIKIPEDSYEMNFVFTDGDGLFDNNLGKDFLFPVEWGLTFEEWVAVAAQRKLDAELKRQEEEKRQAEEARKRKMVDLLEQDKQRGRARAEDFKKQYQSLLASQAAQRTAAGLLWFTTPEAVQAGQKAKLYFNIKIGPLKFLSPLPAGQSITVKYGFNGWKNPVSSAMQRAAEGEVKEALATDDWWVAELDVPADAAMISFVLNYNQHWDNNNRQDYRFPTALPEGMTLDKWVDDLAEKFRKEEYEVRMEAARAEEARQVKLAKQRAAAREEAQAVQRRQIKHVLFTEPEVVEADQEVTIYYNPQNTPLNGSHQIYLVHGFNRWKHKLVPAPLEMQPPGVGGLHWRVTVTIPKDAFKLDFVFANVASGNGIYDNRGGLDYSLPVVGTPFREPPLHVVHIAIEMAPIAKVGGLGDVVTALARAVKDEGHNVEVIVPRYDFFLQSPLLRGNMEHVMNFAWGGTEIFVSSAIVEGLRVFFLEPKNGYFARTQVYGEVWDDEWKFDFFCKAALEFLLKSGRQPDILHAHDWSTAHVAKAYWVDYNPYGLYKPKVVFTIHNLEFGQKRITEAATYCQKFTTVSPTYAMEIAANPVISANVHKFMGIRNGIDSELWDPETCQWLPMGFTNENVVEGKRAAKQALRQRCNLTSNGDKLIVGVVSRLTKQKGMHLIKHAAFRTIERGGQFVLLGNAPNPKDQADFDDFAAQMRQTAWQDSSFNFKYDEPLSHLIYAACDIILVPSVFEPCGLTQLIAMRYGAVPVVRHTGGLKDTVFDVDFDKARAAWSVHGSNDYQLDKLDATNGFAFEGMDPPALDYALNRAIDAWYNDRAWFHSLQKRCMEQDWSWSRPALDYIELYNSAIRQP